MPLVKRDVKVARLGAFERRTTGGYNRGSRRVRIKISRVNRVPRFYVAHYRIAVNTLSCRIGRVNCH